MRSKPESCIGCGCLDHGTDFSRIEGTGSSGVMFVGEASGEMEARDELPFRPYAAAGSVLERVLRRMGMDRQQFSVTNVLRCRPRQNFLENAPWEHSAINHCRPNLDRAIAERRPRAILALGGIATRELTELAGKAQGVTHLAGYVLPGPGRQDGTAFAPLTTIPVVPNFHPAYLRRGKASHQGVFARILQRAVNIAKGTDRNWLWGIDPESPELLKELRYEIRPTLADADAYSRYVYDNPSLVLSYDIETDESTSLDEDAREGFSDTYIRLVQFAVEGRGAIAIPWESGFLPIIGALLRSPNPKCGHNVWQFDNKVLRAAGDREGIDVAPRGVIHDTLAMFHHWQPDLPAHLQFTGSFVQFPFPWKHLAATNTPFYGCCDVDSTLRLFTMLERTLKRDQIWGDQSIGYVGQVYEVRPVLAGMEDRGMPIDDDARVALGAEFEKAQGEMLVELVSLAGPLGNIHPKNGYIREPKDTTGMVQREFTDVDDNLNMVGVTRWCRVDAFNPNSRPQVIAYMKTKGHPVPKDKHRENEEGDNPETTAAKELMRLAAKTGDTFYLKVIEYRGMTKMRGTYVDGFAPGPDGCVHTTFGFGTGIGQLTSRNPNIQNFPKLKPTPALAKAMRRMVAAKPSNIITEWDFKSCHVITLGFLAEDLEYMRQGRLDIHSFVAGHFLHLWDAEQIARTETDDQLRARYKWLKSDSERKHVRDDQAKHGILGIGNGLKAKGLYERYMENFPPRACPACHGCGRESGARPGLSRKCSSCKGTGLQSGLRIAQEVLEIAERLFPKVFAWQTRIQKLAHDQQFLRTQFGHIRRFYEVFRWDSSRHEMGHGDQAEEAIAFWLANIAFGHIREKLKELAAAGLDEKYGLFNNVHDSFMFHFDEGMLAQHVQDVYPILTSPSKVLRHPTICPDGLVIDVEGSWGYRWSDMQEINVKEAMCQEIS